MTTALPERPPYDIFRSDRPGWIPEWVGDEWDPHPYAYQTAEELMPAGIYHSLYLQIPGEMLRPLLPRLGLRLLLDVFIFYRDWEGRKQRIAPDAVIAPAVDPPPEVGIHSYDLDVEPLPLCVVDVMSPRSRVADRLDKRLFYAALKIQEYLLLDIEDEHERLRPQIALTLWRLEQGAPDAEGYVLLETLGVRLRADGRNLLAHVAATGEPLRTSIELAAALAAAEQARQSAEQARESAEQARESAEQRAEAEGRRAPAGRSRAGALAGRAGASTRVIAIRQTAVRSPHRAYRSP